METYIKVEDVEKYYGSSGIITKAVERVSFEISKGEFIGIMGESGSGKTSLLNVLATIDTATAGHIYFEGKDITKMSEDVRSEFRKENLGFIFQNFNLLDTMTLQENIYMPLILNEEKSNDIIKRTEEIINILGIKEVGNKYPYQVSGGQQQRVAIARALASKAPILLADEPTGNLDEDTANEIISIFQKLAHEQEKCVVVVTHSRELAEQADIVLRLKKGKIADDTDSGEN